ncbi:MAG: Fic family protein [Bacilli bacterium]|nr:Fic family protein [Bacilli bacterium]
MKYLTVKEYSKKWNISERTARNYCSSRKIKGVYQNGGCWCIPEDADLPRRINENKNNNYLLKALRLEKKDGIKGRIYHRLQIDLTYNSNHIEGSKLTHDETRYIFETRTIGIEDKSKVYKIDDIVETINHFECIDRVIDFCNYSLSESFIKELHKILKTGTSDAKKSYFAVGDYKKLENEVGDIQTTPPQLVESEINKLLEDYNAKDKHTFDEILDFHVKFERIHPFQDGNGRIGRLIIFKECLKNNIVPFIITEELKMFYYRGLSKWNDEKGWLRDTCLTGQDIIKSYLDYFHIKH